MKARPSKGPGDRFHECRLYDECLDVAGLRSWKAWSCEECDLYKSIFGKKASENELKDMSTPPGKKENIRLCEDCKEKPTISPNNPYCASCMAIRSHKKRPRNKKAAGSTKRKDTTQGQGKRNAEIGQPRADFEVVFSEKYSQVLKEVEKLAEEEIRSTEEQIVYIIKNYLSNTQATKSH
ncbi:MAG TPA: hypothetical protein VMW09_06855 [Desulfatiglandales bacterium]|nr:hypothetical protein [Desulfatiglandales bacterium]